MARHPQTIDLSICSCSYRSRLSPYVQIEQKRNKKGRIVLRLWPLVLVISISCIQPDFAAANSELKVDACRKAANSGTDDAAKICSDTLAHIGLSDHQRSETLHYRGRAYATRGDFRQAIDDQTNVIRLAPEYPDASYYRGIANYRIGAFDKAIADFDQSILLRPNHVFSYGWRGHAKMRTGKYADAIEDYYQSFCKGGDNFGLFDGIGLANYLKSDIEKSIAHFDSAIKRSRKFSNAYFHRSLAYRRLGQLDEADADQKKALKFDRDFYSNPSFLRLIQFRLRQLGYFQGPIDGQINEQLTNAAATFLNDNKKDHREKIGFELMNALEDQVFKTTKHERGHDADRVDASFQATDIPFGKSAFVFSDWDGPRINVWTYKPPQSGPSTPIVVALHGSGRDGAYDRDQWSILADRYNLVVIAPEFSNTSFPKLGGYNLGNVFKGYAGEMQSEKVWAFSAIEPLFDHVVESLDGEQSEYYLFGHSAGAQFVHRFLYYKPEARVALAFPANAGWYTLPSYSEKFPYGILTSGIHDDDLRSAFARDVVLLLGDRDTRTGPKNVRSTKGTERQGPHRLARGKNFYATAEAKADRLDTPFNWRLEIVEGVGHRSGPMACAAARYIN